jgi:hypothetical protein
VHDDSAVAVKETAEIKEGPANVEVRDIDVLAWIPMPLFGANKWII